MVETAPAPPGVSTLDPTGVIILRVLRPSDAESIAHGLKALADPTRLQIVTMLADAGQGGMCVCDLVSPLRIGQSTVSHHLKVLTAAGLVGRVKRGTWGYYSLDRDALRALFARLPGQ